MRDEGKSFGKRFHNFLKSQDIIVAEAARKLEMSRSFVGNIIADKQRPSFELMVKLKETFGLSMDYLMFGLGEQVYITSSGNMATLESEYVLVPLISQSVSAGPGQDILDSEVDIDDVKHVPLPKSWTGRYGANKVKACYVKGDSMTGINLFDGDIVFYVPGLVSGEGVYVYRLGNDVFVKRLEFNPINGSVLIHSENTRYQTTVIADPHDIMILGKVKGWLHNHPY